jgi:hypothetical protein
MIVRFLRPIVQAAAGSSRNVRRNVGLLFVAGAAVAAGCQGVISEPDRPMDDYGPNGAGPAGFGGGGSGIPGSPGSGTNGSAGDPAKINPSLDAIATQYFPGQAVTNGPKRLFRLTRNQLDVTTKTLLPNQYSETAVAAMPRDPLQTNYEYADNLSFNAANFTPYTNWVAQLVDRVKTAPQAVIDCAASGNSPACLVEQSKKFVSKAFRGVATDAQLTRFSDFFTASVASVGLPTAVADLVDVVLTSPNYVFREEVQIDGSGLILPAQQLQNITYTLADAPPETVGLTSATPSVYLQTPQLTQATIDQILSTKEARAKLLRFFLAWLEVKEPDEFTIATSVFPEFTPDVAAAIVNETKSFLERQLSAAVPRMKDLTESTQSVVSNAEAFLYGISAPAAPAVVDLDPAKRLGIFTQPGVLASHSGPTTTRLVKRGVFFVRKVMCMPLGSPPPDVNTTIPPTAMGTERQKVETVTAAARCQGCHGVINPFGFMQENFDAIGRWRTTDQGMPVNASITANFLDEGPLATSTPVDALRGFTRSLRFQQCFARQLFRFYEGRDEASGDDPVLRQMFFDFANNEKQEIVGMLRTLASSTSFSRRSEAP